MFKIATADDSQSDRNKALIGTQNLLEISSLNRNFSVNEILETGETLVWKGKPEYWPFIMMASWWIIPFSLVWSSIVFIATAIVIEARSLKGLLFIVPFLLAAIYVLFGRFWTWSKYWRNTLYLVTNRRIMITAGAFRLKILSWNLSEIDSINLEFKKPGLGHINFVKSRIFNSAHPFNTFIILPTWTTSKGIVTIAPSFRYIKEPEMVCQIIRSVK